MAVALLVMTVVVMMVVVIGGNDGFGYDGGLCW